MADPSLFLIRFSHTHESFREAEIRALAELEGIDMEILEYSLDSPFCVVRLSPASRAPNLIQRSILAQSISELWARASSLGELHAALRADTPHLWPRYAECSWKFRIDSFRATRPHRSIPGLIDSFAYLDFKGPIALREPDEVFSLFEAWPDPSRPGERTTPRDPNSHQPERVFFGRMLGAGARDLAARYDLKKRRYIATTSMDAELALVTANIALAAPGKLFYDPFVGTGSFPVACAHFGALALGSDIDGRTIRGKTAAEKTKGERRREEEAKQETEEEAKQETEEESKQETEKEESKQETEKEESKQDVAKGESKQDVEEESKETNSKKNELKTPKSKSKNGPQKNKPGSGTCIRHNFEQYGLLAQLGPMFAADLTNTPIRVPNTATRLLDGIVCDPPYGVREGLRVLGHRDAERAPWVLEASARLYNDPSYIPSKKPYSFHAMLDDILVFAAATLVDAGRLAFWLPAANDDGAEVMIPRHPCLELVDVCTQPFSKWSRRLITYRRLRDADVDPAALAAYKPYAATADKGGTTADDLNPFRKGYFSGFAPSV